MGKRCFGQDGWLSLGSRRRATSGREAPSPTINPATDYIDTPVRREMPEGPVTDLGPNSTTGTRTRCITPLILGVPVSAYPYEVQNQRYFSNVLVPRVQVRDGQPVDPDRSARPIRR
jgi:hypothetical protein